MPTVVIIPVKSFALGKQRLSEVLDDERRSFLGRSLADHSASAVEAAGLVPLIVTADHQVARWATLSGFPSLPDVGSGLDAAAHTGVEWAQRARSPWIVLHSDLPLIDQADVLALRGVAEENGDVLAPSADGGTSAIGSTGPFRFSFGIASFHRHLTRMPEAQIVVRAGLALDLDDPNDLTAAAETDRGAWLREIIA